MNYILCCSQILSSLACPGTWLARPTSFYFTNAVEIDPMQSHSRFFLYLPSVSPLCYWVIKYAHAHDIWSTTLHSAYPLHAILFNCCRSVAVVSLQATNFLPHFQQLRCWYEVVVCDTFSLHSARNVSHVLETPVKVEYLFIIWHWHWWHLY